MTVQWDPGLGGAQSLAGEEKGNQNHIKKKLLALNAMRQKQKVQGIYLRLGRVLEGTSKRTSRLGRP